MTEALAIRGLTVDYAGLPALTGARATFPVAQMTAIVGPNGAGKSTMLKAALGLVPRVAGEVAFFGRPLAEVRDRVAYMPQRASVDWDFPVRAIDVVLMGMYRRLGPWRSAGRRDIAEAMAALDRVGLADLARRQIGALSGGQQQRVFLARALAQGAELYLLDEPFAGVDAATEAAIITVLKALRDNGAGVVAVHHDLATVPGWFDRVLMLNRATVAEGPVEGTFTPEVIARTYAAPRPLPVANPAPALALLPA